MDLIEDIAVVTEIRAGEVLVEIPRSENCEHCAAHVLCNKTDTPVRHWIKTDLHLEQGDYVKIFMSPALRLTSGFFIFVLPVLIMLGFYLVPRFLLHASENISILVSILSLGISGIVIYSLDKSWGKQIRFEIMEKLNPEDFEESFNNEDKTE
jgi:positive regulator of sigma E activity